MSSQANWSLIYHSSIIEPESTEYRDKNFDPNKKAPTHYIELSLSITPLIQDFAIKACPARVGCTPSTDQ